MSLCLPKCDMTSLSSHINSLLKTINVMIGKETELGSPYIYSSD